MLHFPVRDRSDLRLLAHSYNFSCALHATVALGLPQALSKGAKYAHEIAEAVGSATDPTARLLHFLASFGVVTVEDGKFALSDVGRHLLPEHPRSLQREVAMFAGAEMYRAWGDLELTLCDGRAAFEHQHGLPLFEYLAGNPDSARRFHQSWHEITIACANETVRAYDFDSVKTITDVGAGYGIYLATILQAKPLLRGVLLDLPFSLEGAPAVLEQFCVSDRVEVVPGDAELAVPPMELALLKSVIHLCDDEKALRILGNIAAALPQTGRVLVVERVIPDDPGFHWSRLVDMTMMVVTGGRERSRADYSRLFASAGLTLTRVIELDCGFSLVEGERSSR